MKPDEAITHLKDCMSETEKLLHPEILAAHKLGIEALDRVRYWRAHRVIDPNYHLPSETEE